MINMIKRFVTILIFLSLTACGGVRYNWNPQPSPNVEYQGTETSDPTSEL